MAFDITKIVKGFNSDIALRVYVSRKASPQIEVFLGNWGLEKLRICIEKTIWITDCLSPEYKAKLKQSLLPHIALIDKFSNEEVYLWVPLKYRLFIEETPGGKDYALNQLEIIRQYLKS